MLLAGIRVVEMGVWVAGPAAAGVMADWGADVVKIEPPAGDPMRRLFQNLAGLDLASCPPFNQDNRGKRSVVLDLRQPDALRVARKLILGADVFVTNYRCDALERLGLDHASLAAEAPRLVYAHVTGYGREGPDRDRAGYDIGAFWARSGIAHLLAPPGEEPVGARGGLGDHVTASHLLAGVLGALFHRERTGRGQLVDACLLRSGIYTIGWDVSLQLELGVCRPNGKREDSFAPTVSSFRCGDDRWVWLLGVEADRHWPRMLEGLELADLAQDLRFSDAAMRRKNARALMALLDARFAERSFAAWTARFDAVDLWWSPVQTPADVVRDPQAEAAGAFTEVTAPDGKGTVRTVAGPVRFGSVDVRPRKGVPGLGEHTEEVLRAAGLGDAEIAKLREAGALGSA
jgi:crotonobetainyl-CoA:carnitine CoA-transferase CaiB-like acyl-CoA transferase